MEIRVGRDSSLEVQESIEVDFGEEQWHGIYRELPLADSASRLGVRRLRIRDLAVTDGEGGSWKYAARRSGRYLSVRIGDPDVRLTGVQRYVIRYRVDNGLLHFPDHDELYWNATGNEWPVPIRRATCTVHLPEELRARRIQANAWVGPQGSTERARAVAREGRAFFHAGRPLGYNEGMTVAVGWPPGVVEQPSVWRRAGWFLTENIHLLLPVVVLLALTLIWYLYGRDPDLGRSVAVRYEPPDTLRPAEVGALVDETVDTRDITATIVDLAVRGYLTIEEGPARGLFGARSYTLRKAAEPGARDPRGGLVDFEKTLFERLFKSGDSVTTADLENRFYSAVDKASQQLYSRMGKAGLFFARPDRVRAFWRKGGGIVSGAGFLLFLAAFVDESGTIPLDPTWGLAILVSGFIVSWFSLLMPRKTPSGKRAALEALGFEEYLSRAEKEDLQLQEKQGLFEKFLPYAISLKVVDRWARAFEGILETSPEWFVTVEGRGAFSPVRFARSVDVACSSLGSALTSTPRSASGGGSAFGGGGGFSGGGFGGGGGRAW